MNTLSVEIPQSALIQAVEQLDPSAFEQFLNDVLLLRARRTAPSISANEMKLVEQIHATVMSEIELSRLAELSDQVAYESVTDEEHSELLRLTDKSERLAVKRVKAASELASLRNETVHNVLISLGLLNSDA